MQVQLNPTCNVFHDGERRMHAKLGLSERLQELGLRMIRDHMPDQHRAFFEMLRIVHLGVVDDDGHPLAITRTGSRGFMRSPDEKKLTKSSLPHAGKPDTLDFSHKAKISVLGLEMETRRRNRMNATIRTVNAAPLSLAVDQSYGNCPKYIQTRVMLDDVTVSAPTLSKGEGLTADDQALIEKSDILMLASRAPVLGDDPRPGSRGLPMC